MLCKSAEKQSNPSVSLVSGNHVCLSRIYKMLDIKSITLRALNPAYLESWRTIGRRRGGELWKEVTFGNIIFKKINF